MSLRFFDSVIFKNGLNRSLKNITFLVSSSLLIILNVIISSLMVVPGAYFVFAIILFFLIAISNSIIFNIANINLIFITDHDLGISNLEIRKGRSSGAIFFSRLLVNKIISFAVILIHYAIFVIICVFKNPLMQNNIALIIFILLIFDIILTAVMLFLFSLKKMKLAIGLTTILGMLILVSPLIIMGQPQQMVGKETNTNMDLSKIFNNESRNEILDLKKRNNIFAEQLLNQGFNYNSIYKMEYKILEDAKSWISYSAMASGVYNIKDIYLVSYFDSIVLVDFDEALKNQFIIKTNNQIIEKNTANLLSNDYSESIYSNRNFDLQKYNFTLNELRKTITEIQKDIPESQKFQFEEFSDLVFNFSKNIINFHSGWRKTISDDIYNEFFGSSPDSFSDDFIEHKKLQTPVGLRLWNQGLSQLMLAGLNTKTFTSPQFKKAAINTYNFLFPWAMTYEVLINPNPFMNDFDLINNSNNNMNTLSSYIYANGGTMINQETENTDEKIRIPNFNPKEVKKDYKSNKLFSKIAYQIVLLIIGWSILVCAYIIFDKKLKI